MKINQFIGEAKIINYSCNICSMYCIKSIFYEHHICYKSIISKLINEDNFAETNFDVKSQLIL